MAMKAKASTVKESLTKKEKADIKKIAEKVKIDHKGAEKPQLLTKIKGDEKVILCTIPVVKWETRVSDESCDDTGKLRCKSIAAVRVVDNCDIMTSAAIAKVAHERSKKLGMPIEMYVAPLVRENLYNKSGFSVSEEEAAEKFREYLSHSIEEKSLDISYRRDSISKTELMLFIDTTAHFLSKVREFMSRYYFYRKNIDGPLPVLPDVDKLTIKNRKFVPVEKPAVPKKPTSKK